ncbi:MAG: hypothetical protein ACRCT2_03365, partial [Plesiomonas shigelloides]
MPKHGAVESTLDYTLLFMFIYELCIKIPVGVAYTTAMSVSCLFTSGFKPLEVDDRLELFRVDFSHSGSNRRRIE